LHKCAYMAWDRILVIFATIVEKENVLPPPLPCARDAETYIRRVRAAARSSSKKNFNKLRKLCRQSVLINLAIVEMPFNRFRCLLVGRLFSD